MIDLIWEILKPIAIMAGASFVTGFFLFLGARLAASKYPWVTTDNRDWNDLGPIRVQIIKEGDGQ